jgi:regulator of protease activity HflC (stomatin/prohibitin superfamily)
MAENEKKKANDQETTEGAKRSEKLDTFKRTMRKIRETGKILIFVAIVGVLLYWLLSEVNVKLPSLAELTLKVSPFLALGTWYFSHSFKMIFEWENGVVFRLGRVFRTHPNPEPVPESEESEGKPDSESGPESDLERRKKYWKFTWPIKKAKERRRWLVRWPIIRTIEIKRRWTFILWPFDEIVFVNMWERRIDIPPQKVVIKEKIKVKKDEKEEEIAIQTEVDVIFYFRIFNAAKAITKIEDVDGAVKDLVLSLLRKKCAELDISELVSGREADEGDKEKKDGKEKGVAEAIRKMLNDEIQKDWGVGITKAEFKEVYLPEAIQEAYNVVFKADKDREAKIVGARGEEKRIEVIYNILKQMDPNLIVRALEALEKMSEGEASTIFLDRYSPSLVQDLIAAFKGAKEKAFRPIPETTG